MLRNFNADELSYYQNYITILFIACHVYDNVSILVRRKITLVSFSFLFFSFSRSFLSQLGGPRTTWPVMRTNAWLMAMILMMAPQHDQTIFFQWEEDERTASILYGCLFSCLFLNNNYNAIDQFKERNKTKYIYANICMVYNYKRENGIYNSFR